MDETTLAAYFRRMAVPRPHTADAVPLHVLHRAHQMTVPFENLSIHLSEPVSLAEDDLIDKIVNRRRGGFCYELNGAFAFLLQAMGAEVKRVAARVYGGGLPGPPFGHMALVVLASDASGPWLIDVGFGSHSVYPLLFDSRTSRPTQPGRSFWSTPKTATWTCTRTGSRSTGSSHGNAPRPTSSRPAGGSRPHPNLISPAAPSARGSPRTAGSPSPAGP